MTTKTRRPRQSVQALQDVLAIGELPIPERARLIQVRDRIAQYRAEAAAFHRSMDAADSDLSFLVQTDLARLRDAVDREIEQRGRIEIDGQPTRFLERVTDYLHDVTMR